MRVIDWIARTVMLVLASLATLALIGSLASVSNSTLGEAFPGRVAAPPVEAEATPAPETAAAMSESNGPGTRTVAPAPPAAEDRAEIARWLKALTYALLALGGFVAAGVIALVRIAGHLGRIAER